MAWYDPSWLYRQRITIDHTLTMIAFTLIITAFMPETWLHPFGPVTKNVPLALATLVMMALED